FRFHLRVSEGALTYVQAGAGVMVGRLRIPLPRWISPRVEAREACGDGRGAYVRVGISAPGFGLVMSYEGSVQVERPLLRRPCGCLLSRPSSAPSIPCTTTRPLRVF